MFKANILIIDDEPAIGRGCAMICRDMGHNPTWCATAAEGRNSLEEGEYDLVLLDIRLPDRDGIDLLAEIHLAYPELHVIMMTGFSTVQQTVQAMKNGAFDYLAKPFSDEELTQAISKALKNARLRRDNLQLRKQLFQRFEFNNIVGDSPAILTVFEAIKKVAPTDATVLINGESGTGKELFAGALHARSSRAEQPFIAIDCSAFSTSLLESELFGHVKGSFTGADRDKQGIFEAANGSTLFLDEVANLDLNIQAKLLRVLEYGQYKPVGGSSIKKTDMRIIAASNQDLENKTFDGTFRPDLYYRLNVFPIHLPPLRQRREDIPKLAYHFLKQFCRKNKKHLDGFSDGALETLTNYHWPGNVRQLKNVIERLVIMVDEQLVDSSSLHGHLDSRNHDAESTLPTTLPELKAYKQHLLDIQYNPAEKAFLQKNLDEADGNISRAAKLAGMQRSNFSTMMKKHNISFTV
ncbi:sigma-54-dependent Fis family transcriptional regulator [Desulfopila sp. IMCC35006]|uniref:sigma-54-dependent transcriptional regulator n=1 Tax=Desulfopila sp. IMCC35006 TaxID=2569542 RepID=UPI0010AB7663|nr:sigma-54 dependent transcriptional regulator [Desulfopila sp. IMCC35006]TKB23889.1 sigma-54-dependent Fis family transcriptional regulator [Desulfopila sp. IMCC35006]